MDQQSSTHWMVRLAESKLFRKLPAANIRILLEHVEKIDVQAGDVIINEGDSGDYYYVIERGVCQVSRRAADGSDKVLAELEAGEAFGEEEMVAGPARNATVRMLTDGELLRLDKTHFIDIVRDPLVDKVPYAIAERMHEQGALWIDVRPAEDFARGSLAGAVNLPLTSLREDAANLITDQPYVICGENAGAAAVGTLLLVQRGFDAVCMTEPVSAVVRAPRASTPAAVEPVPQVDNEPDAVIERARRREADLSLDGDDGSGPIPRDLYDDTYVGQSLADLIDQMHSRHQDLLATDAGAPGDDNDAVELIDLKDFESEVEQTLPQSPEELPALSLAGEEPERDPPRGAASPGDEISSVLRELEDRLRKQIALSTEQQRRAVRAELEEKVASVKRSAVQEVRKQIAAYRERLRTEHTHKERKLKAQYDKLMALAHRISRQKAELQRARKDLQTKLEVTARLQAEIDNLRDNLSGRLESFDQIEDDPVDH